MSPKQRAVVPQWHLIGHHPDINTIIQTGHDVNILNTRYLLDILIGRALEWYRPPYDRPPRGPDSYVGESRPPNPYPKYPSHGLVGADQHRAPVST